MIDNDLPLYLIAFALTFAITALAEKTLIPVLAGRAKQPIYSEGPGWHLSKSGTPTMGGIAFLIGTSVTLIASSIYMLVLDNRDGAISLLLSIGFSILNALIGVIDDLKKLRKKENAGLTPKQKLFLQALVAALFLSARSFFLNGSTTLSFTFGEVELNALYYPLALLLLLGITNCANLTDGIDGLASSVAFAIGISLFYISFALSTEVSFIAASLLGASTGFLIFNIHPAKVFMGDTGSLFFGALIASACFALNNPLLSIPLGGVYVIEGISVILQVLVFKISHRRLFKMAPIHHHLERLGWSEDKICISAILLTFLLSIPAFILYLP